MPAKFHYVYILQSVGDRQRFYVGCTEDLHQRLTKHNGGEVPHTSKYKPWEIKTAIAFRDTQRAIEFERYLKSASGRAFAASTYKRSPECSEGEGCRAEALSEGGLYRSVCKGYHNPSRR